MNSKPLQILAILAFAIVMGILTRPLDRSLRRDLGKEKELSSIESIGPGLGQGISFAILGGYRSLVANLVWLSMNSVWEKKDFDSTYARIRLATSVDPRPEIFWLNGARIISNDMPTWRTGGRLADQVSSTSEARKPQREFAEEALAFLRQSETTHKDNPKIYLEKAIIHWQKLNDIRTATELFGEAARLPNAPYHAARIYADLLVKIGKREESLAFLRQLYPTLPDNDIMARKHIVLGMIEDLEEEISENKKN